MKQLHWIVLFICLVISGPIVPADICITNAPWLAVGDGVTDNTASITSAIAAVKTNDTLYFPPGVYRVRANASLILKSHMRVDLGGASVIASNFNGVYNRIFWIPNTTPPTRNIKIFNGTIIGSKTGSPTWAMGISVDNAQDIVLEDLTIKDCYADGIYIGGDPFPEGSNGVRVRRCRIENCGRNAVSLVSAYNVSFEDCVFRDTFGTYGDPYAGIDIEPNAGCEVFGVTVSGCMFLNNSGNGVYFHPYAGARGWGDVTVIGCVFDGNKKNGYAMVEGTGCVITGNRFINHTNTTYGGVYLATSSNVVVQANLLENNHRGIYADRLLRGVITDNNIHASGLASVGDGITLRGVVATNETDMLVGDNIVVGYTRGIYVDYGRRVSLTGNKILASRQQGIFFPTSTYDSLVAGNILASNSTAGTYPALHTYTGSTNHIAGNLFRSHNGTTNLYLFGGANAHRVIHNDLANSLLANGLGNTVTNFDNLGKNWNK